MTFSSLKPGAKRTCKNRACRNKFVPTDRHPFAIACCTGCEIILAKRHIEKVQAARAKKERKADKARKEKIKTRSDHMREAQQAFNAYRREVCRIAGYACPCCDIPLDWTGNNVDAGHYRSVGSAPHARFTENNVWAQRKQCNRYGAGRAVDYRIGLIKRIGLEAVEVLEADQAPRKWTIDELRQVKTEYKGKLKALQGLMGVGE
jgi:hypothetical protein